MFGAPEVARALGLSERMARVFLKKWVEDGWLIVADPSRRKRAYELTAIYRQYTGGLSARQTESRVRRGEDAEGKWQGELKKN